MIKIWRADGRAWFHAILIILMAVTTGLLLSSSLKWLSLGLLAAGGLLIISLIKPAWIFTYAYPSLIWMGQIPIPLGGTTLSLERLLILVGGAGFLVAFLGKRLPMASVPRWVAAGFGLWFGMYFLSLVVFPSNQGLSQVLGFAQKALMAYMFFAVLRTAGQIKTVLRLALLSSLILSFFTVAVYVQEGTLFFIRSGSFIAGKTLSESLFQGLARSGAGNTMAMWIALIFVWQAKNKKQLLWGIFLVLWFGVLALFALRRQVLVTIPIGLSLMFLHRPIGHRKQVFLIGVVLLGAIIAFLMLSPEWLYRLSIETLGQLEAGSDPRLMLLLRFTPSAFISSPFLGHGPANYANIQIRFPDMVPVNALMAGGSSPHNAWSAAAVEAGVGAFIGLSLFVYGLGRPLWRKRRTDDRNMDMIWAFAPLIFIQVLINMFFGHAVALPATWFWYGFLLALDRITRAMNVSENGSYAPALCD